MMVKKYVVQSIPEGMNRIKAELGTDIIIVSQRKVRKKGITGYFTSKQIEITVAYENDIISDKNKYIYDGSSNKRPKKTIKVYDNKSVHESTKEEVVPKKREQKEQVTKQEDSKINMQIIKDVNEMKAMISGLMNINNKDKNVEEDFVNYKKLLKDRDISEELIENIMEKLKCKDNISEEVDIAALKDIIVDVMDCDINYNVEIKDGVTAFVGPTGVGKTTTIAKLAGKYSLEYKKKVGLITVDTYRIGAIEQLKTYAEIMGIPFEVVFDIKEMEKAIDGMKDCDMIFLDTTGRSSKNLMQLQELRAFIKKADPNMVFLVLSATTKSRDINSIIEGYKVMEYESLIVTKLDETTTYGSMLTMVKNSKVPISYITVGQGVPQDIKKISHKEVSEIVLGETSIC